MQPKLFDISRAWLVAGLLCIGVPVVEAAGDNWEEEALLLYNSGSPKINELRALSTGDERLKSYALTLSLLFNEPLREENALIARASFDELFKKNPHDDVGLASAYYLARINHRHLDEPDLDAARSAYQFLFESYPTRFFGELAFQKYLLMEIYKSRPSESAIERLMRLEYEGRRLVIPDMRRSYHRSIGEAYKSLDLSMEKAYEHLKAAYDIESSVPETQTDLMWSLSEIAEKLGRDEVAIATLEDFVKTARWDDRHSEAATRLSRLKSNQ